MFLGLIFFLELTAGVLAFIFKDWIKDQLNFFINNNVKAYRDDIDLQNLIDFAQEYVSRTIALSDLFVLGLVECEAPYCGKTLLAHMIVWEAILATCADCAAGWPVLSPQSCIFCSQKRDGRNIGKMKENCDVMTVLK